MRKISFKTKLVTGIIGLIIILVIGLVYAKKQMLIMKPEYVKGEILIKYKPAISKSMVSSSIQKIRGEMITDYQKIGVSYVKLPKDLKVEDAIKILSEDPNIEYAEPNYLIYLDYIPNDARFVEQYGVHNTGSTGGTVDADIDGPEAWDKQKGSKKVIIGITDTGIDYKHEDLSSNIWNNTTEVPGDGIDNDGNGYVDDIHGYDFINSDGDPMDDHNHGTHVAGIIAAIGDNKIGIAGVNYKSNLMALKFMSPITCGTFDCGASGSSADAAEAIIYATDNGVNIINASWGGGSVSTIIRDAIWYADSLGVLFVAAAGNDGTDNDSIPHYPSSYGAAPYNLKNVIAVASTDHNDKLSSFSNYGILSVDLGAPGEDVLSTIIGNNYDEMSGTSMASPHVAGVAGLVWAEYPLLNHYQVKKCILNNVDLIPSLSGKVTTEGRLNAEKALNCRVFFPGKDTLNIPDTILKPKIETISSADVNIENVDYVWRIKYKSNVELFRSVCSYGMILFPIIFIIGWKNLKKRKNK